MSRKYIFAALGASILCLSTLPAQAQRTSYDGSIDIVPSQLSQRGDSLVVELEIRLEGVRVGSPMSVELEPRLASATEQVYLPAVSVKGRSNYKVYERGLALDGYPADPLYAAAKGYGPSDRTIRYRYVLPYEPWMADARLELVRRDKGCGESTLTGVSTLIDQVALEKIPEPIPQQPPTPLLAYVTPQAEEVKSRELQAEVRLDFVVNKTDIDPAYRGNPRELARIRSIIDELYTDPSVSVHALEIIGYASPEGSLENNRRLSEGRAMALRNYLSGYYNFPSNVYRIAFGGENWAGLLKELETYPAVYAEEVASIIENVESVQDRKRRLQTLRGGVPYRELLRDVYPGLRTAVCVVEYRIKGFTAQDAAEVYRVRPQNLSLNEFYLVAQTFAAGSREFIEVFETAVRMYPDDEIANLNAAAAALEHGNTEAAERYLNRIDRSTSLPEYLNARGALAALRSDYTGAAGWFRQAASKGLEAAVRNLEMLPEQAER